MKPATFPFGTVLCLALLCALSSVRAESLSADDEQALRSAGLSSDGASLLAAIRKHTLTTETRKKVDGLIARLGADSFSEREKASRQLFALGHVALLQLREANKHHDPEIARRARSLIERIEQELAHQLPAAVVRLLAVRKPDGAVEALLDYLPYAEDENLAEEVQNSLAVLARRDGKLEPALRRVLDDPRKAPAIRMRVALALAVAGEREAIPVLIELLAELPNESFAEVESALYQLAGDSPPRTPAGMGPAERKKCRDAWAAWWKVNADCVDLARLSDGPRYGFTLICENFNNRVYEIDHNGKERWAIANVSNPLDAVVLPGNRVLIAECNANRVTERDFKSNILWQKQVHMPTCVRRLPNGNTFITTHQGEILEVDHAGKVIYTVQNVPKDVTSAFRSRKGPIVYLTQKGECILADTTGKRLKSIDTHHAFTNANQDWIDRSANGGILIAQRARNKVVEYTLEGKKVREVDAPQVTTVMDLPNGRLLVSSHQRQRVYELDRAGKVVWEYKAASQVYRARRR